jgi:serine/threonine-protein kinase
MLPHDQPAPAPSAHADELAAGEVLGAYRILGRIAVGGMGVIYRAEHVRLGRKVALKVLRHELLERADILHRFFEEARAVNEIGHPNIIDIIDFVEDFQSNPPRVYMVMELLVGQDLAARIEAAGQLDAEEAVAIAKQASEALIAVHRAKILHRDLKPENIFLCRREEGTQVKLLDFGVAKTFGERQQVGITDPGTAVGTPEYMAPEQVLGRELDDRTDIYALGLVLYDMLTDSVPFQSERYGEVLVMQVKETPEPVSARRKPGRPVPARLERLVMRCLEKDPALRFQSMSELREALEEVLVAEAAPVQPVAVTPPPAPAPGEPDGPDPTLELRPRRRRVVVAGLVAGTLVGGGIALWILAGTRSNGSGLSVTRPARGPDAGPRPLRALPPDAAMRPDLPTPATPDLAARPKTKRIVPKKKGEKKKPGLEGTVDPFNP